MTKKESTPSPTLPLSGGGAIARGLEQSRLRHSSTPGHHQGDRKKIAHESHYHQFPPSSGGKNRIRYLPDITALYRELADEAAGRARVKLITAHELSKQKLKELTAGLKHLVGKQVIMEAETDPELIGGVVARIGGMVYDGSVKTQLDRLKETLAKG